MMKATHSDDRLLLLLSAFVVFVIAGSAILFGMRAVNLATPTSAVIPDPTANWKTYTNSEQGITFKYPSDLLTIEDKKSSVGWNLNLENNAKTISIVVNLLNSNIYEVPWSGGKKTTITKNNLALFHLPGPNATQAGEIQGRPTLKSYDNTITTGEHTTLSILDGKRLIKLVINTRGAGDLNLHDQILSTFKFTN